MRRAWRNWKRVGRRGDSAPGSRSGKASLEDLEADMDRFFQQFAADEEAPASEATVQAEAPEEPVAEAETNHEPEVVTDYEIVIDPEL